MDADILVLVSEVVVVAVLSEWWLVPTTADHCGHIPDCIYIHNSHPSLPVGWTNGKSSASSPLVHGHRWLSDKHDNSNSRRQPTTSY